MVILTNDSNYLRNAIRMKILDLFLNESDKDWSAEFLEMKKKNEVAAKERKAERKAKCPFQPDPGIGAGQGANGHTRAGRLRL